MTHGPVPLHSTVSAHLFGGEDVIEFEDFFEKNEDITNTATTSFQRLLSGESVHPATFDIVSFPSFSSDVGTLSKLYDQPQEQEHEREREPDPQLSVPFRKGTNGNLLLCWQSTNGEDPSYQLDFELTQDDSNLHAHCGYYVNVYIRFASAIVGQVNAFLIDREKASPRTFCEVCDKCVYIRNVVFKICDQCGRVKYGSINDLDVNCLMFASRQGLVVFTGIMIDSEHRHKNVGIRCAQALLYWLNTDAAKFLSTFGISPIWTLALVAPSSQENGNYTQNCPDERMISYGVEHQFMQIGFRQTNISNSIWYLTPMQFRLFNEASFTPAPAIK